MSNSDQTLVLRPNSTPHRSASSFTSHSPHPPAAAWPGSGTFDGGLVEAPARIGHLDAQDPREHLHLHVDLLVTLEPGMPHRVGQKLGGHELAALEQIVVHVATQLLELAPRRRGCAGVGFERPPDLGVHEGHRSRPGPASRT